MIHTINSQLDMRFIVMTIYKASYRMHIFTILCCNCPLYQPNSLFYNETATNASYGWKTANEHYWPATDKVAFYAYIIPFLISTTAGSVLAVVIVLALQRAGALNKIQNRL